MEKNGLAVEIEPDRTYKCSWIPAKFHVPRDFECFLKKTGLPEKSIRILYHIKIVTGKNIIEHVKQAGYRNIPDSNIWVKPVHTNPLDY